MHKIFQGSNPTTKSYISATFTNEDGRIIFLSLQEGSGDNLTQEDIDDGYVDYVDYSFVYSDEGVLDNNEAGGILLLKTYVLDLYGKTGLTDQSILDEIIKMEDFVPVSPVYIL